MGRDPGSQTGYGTAATNGSTHLWRRRFWQNRGGHPRGVQGGDGWAAGRCAGANHRAGPAALQHILRAHGGVPHLGGIALAVPLKKTGRRHHCRPRRRSGRHRHRHTQADSGQGPFQEPRVGDHRRRTTLWRAAQREAQDATPNRGCVDAHRHTDPAHTAHGAHRGARHEHHRDTTAGPVADRDHGDRVQRENHPQRHSARTQPRRAGVLFAQPRDHHRDHGRAYSQTRAQGAAHRRTRPDAQRRSRKSDDSVHQRRG